MNSSTSLRLSHCLNGVRRTEAPFRDQKKKPRADHGIPQHSSRACPSKVGPIREALLSWGTNYSLTMLRFLFLAL